MNGAIIIGVIAIIAAALYFFFKNKKKDTPTISIPEPVPNPVRYSENAYPTNKFWTMEHGTWAEYSHNKFDGVYNRETGVITVTELRDAPDKLRITNINFFMPNERTELAVARVHTQWDVPATDADVTLKEVLLERSGFVGDVEVIGEAGNVSCAGIYPPEPLMTKNPIPGETIDVDSNVITMGGKEFKFKTRYKTVKIDGHFLYTSLLENVGNPGQEYAYYHCFDGNLYWIMYGLVDVDGKILDGLIATRVKEGKN